MKTKAQKRLEAMKNRGVGIQIDKYFVLGILESGQEKIVVETEEERDQIIEAMPEALGIKFVNEFADAYKENLIDQLNNLEGTAQKPKVFLKKGTGKGEGTVSLRKEIIESIIMTKSTDGEGNYKKIIEIKHPLTKALNYGTGIYGEKRQPITAKSKKYMFIPGVEFAKALMKRNYTKQMGSKDAAHNQVRLDVRGRRKAPTKESK